VDTGSISIFSRSYPPSLLLLSSTELTSSPRSHTLSTLTMPHLCTSVFLRVMPQDILPAHPLLSQIPQLLPRRLPTTLSVPVNPVPARPKRQDASIAKHIARYFDSFHSRCHR
jgi:hypothetical protein